MSKVAVKGIRVNQLAKELGVESKSILNKCREEGLGDKVPNHMTVLSVGLAETVREWFSGGEGGGSTAVQTAPPVETLTKPKTRKTIKKPIAHDEEPINGVTAEAPPQIAPPAPVAAPTAPVAEAPAPKTAEPIAPVVTPVAPEVVVPVAEAAGPGGGCPAGHRGSAGSSSAQGIAQRIP